MVYIIPNFLILHLGENNIKIRTNLAKLQMHENLHKNVNKNMFSFTFLCTFSGVFDWQLKQQICEALDYLFLKWLLIHLKWWSSSFRPYQIFPIFMVQMFFPQIQQAPGPNFRKVGKSLKGKFINIS